MASDYKLQCPRPRNARACAHCRAKRTRCLRELPYSPCRRCQALHLQCQWDNQVSPAKPFCPGPPKTEGVDVLSGLFGASEKPPPPDNVVSFHHRLFQNKFSSYDELPPEPVPHMSLVKAVRSTALDANRAAKLVERFRSKSSYFPFVTVPEDIATPQHRFLYLAVLTVSATDDMPLLRSLDCRFREVLAEKVVVAGEKSLDYLQGLLVYIAWDNLNLRPRSFQIYQYLQIAISIVAELRYSDDCFPDVDQAPTRVIDARNACLGCYYLSSLLSTHTRRPHNAVLSNTLKSYLSELSQSESSNAQAISRSLYLQMNIEAAYRHRGSVHEISSNAFDTPAIRAAHLFLVLFRESTARSTNSDRLADFHTIVTSANSFFDYLVSLPIGELTKFGTAEWTRFVMAIHDVSVPLSAAATHPELVQTARNSARQISVYLECLANRMGQLSLSGHNPGEFPDMLYLLKSVLDLLLPLESKLGLAIEDQQDSNAMPSMGSILMAGRCPALVGLQETDFWSAYQNSGNDIPSYDVGLDFDGLFGGESGFELSHDEWMDAACNLNM